jgi:probable O-glycosylation ligase (exosortase A-associated)
MNFDVVSDPTTRTYIRNNPFMGDGNDFSLSLCITIPLCLFLFNNVDRKINKAIYFSFFILMFLAIIGNSSRGGTLAILCILLYYGIKSQNKIKFVFFILLMSCLVFVYAPPSYYNRIEHINNWQEPSAQGRVNAWKGAIQMASDHPFLGIGAGHFPIKYASDYQIGKEYIEKKTAHSMYFLALGELGFPGFIIIIYLIIFNFLKNEKLIKLIKKSNIDNRKENLSLIIHLNASLVGFSVAALFLSVLYYPHIFVLAGIFDSARRIVNKRLYHDKYLPEDENEYLSISVNKFSNTHSLS